MSSGGVSTAQQQECYFKKNALKRSTPINFKVVLGLNVGRTRRSSIDLFLEHLHGPIEGEFVFYSEDSE